MCTLLWRNATQKIIECACNITAECVKACTSKIVVGNLGHVSCFYADDMARLCFFRGYMSTESV